MASTLVLTVFGSAAGVAADTHGSPGTLTFVVKDGPLVLAPAAVRDGTPVDGIPPGPMVEGGYHIHAHLAVFVNGVQAWIPAGVGVTRPLELDPHRNDPAITGAKGFYWLHTHDESGVIHAEAPQEHAFTLGQFFDMWGQPLSRQRVGPATGAVKVLVDGKPFLGEPRTLVLRQHQVIQLNVGQDVEFQPYDFPSFL
ncbi:hypothetical protein GCM10009838_39480 [Catenulispora subtropica]|uniref:Uncharacterized protein n=1 Tax=Catenulispora subtropica TaxID=450798 RepID=A0ABN2RV69_9ACTN